MTDYTNLMFALRDAAPSVEKEYCSPFELLMDSAADAIKALVAERDDYKQALDELGVTPAEARKGAERSRAKDALITNLTAERDAAFAMSKCECESNEACENLVALHDEITYLEKCVSSHEKDKCSAQESFGKCFTENQKLHKEINALKSERDAALTHADEEQKRTNTYCQQLFERDAEIERLKHGLRIALEAIEHYAGPPKDAESIEAMRFLKELLK